MSDVASPGVQITSTAFAAVLAVTSLVPPESFYGGAAPKDLQLPALVFRSISRTRMSTLSGGKPRRMIERVEVTAIAASYAEQTAIVSALESAGDLVLGDIAGCSACSIRWENSGPDIYSADPPMFHQAADFLVSFIQA